MVSEGVRAKMLFGNSHDDILGMWKPFLPKALKEGNYIVAPGPFIVEKRGWEGWREFKWEMISRRKVFQQGRSSFRQTNTWTR
jgi:hypothetical protein